MKKHIILLNGPSSGGKSTLSRELQACLTEARGQRYAVVSIDDFLPMTATEPIYEDDVFEISGSLCKSALAALETHDGVIIDHVITSQRIYDQLRALLTPYPLQLVRVTCPVEILRQREQSRGNRCPHTAPTNARPDRAHSSRGHRSYPKKSPPHTIVRRVFSFYAPQLSDVFRASLLIFA